MNIGINHNLFISNIPPFVISYFYYTLEGEENQNKRKWLKEHKIIVKGLSNEKTNTKKNQGTAIPERKRIWKFRNPG